MRTGPILRRLAAGFLALLAVAGCDKKTSITFVPNKAPEVRLTAAPITSTDRYFYAYRMSWVGFDPDGRVDHFLFATLDPDSVDQEIDRLAASGGRIEGTPWQRTTKNEEIIFFRATQPDTNQVGISTDYHTFAIAAVDNEGVMSKPVWRSFNAFTQAPSTTIESPRPPSEAIVTPAVRIRWTGADPDGQLNVKPLYYRYRLFRQRDPHFPGVGDAVQHILNDTRILRWKYAPSFAPTDSCPACGWDSASTENPEVQFVDLIPTNRYLFAVTGFDEAGAYDPVFSRASNLLLFSVSYAGTLGPTLCMFNDFLFFCYTSGGYATDPSRYVDVEVPADTKIRFNWFGVAPEGAAMQSYRWVLDLQDLTDETARTDEVTDWYHWSAKSLQTTTAEIGPFRNNGEIHLFFIEAEDNNGLRSLGILRFTVVRATFENDVLFVDDTRMQGDSFDYLGNLEYPRGSWPTAAELDTFLYARGGVPWKGYPGVGVHGEILDPDFYTTSPVGLFAGFPFTSEDTLGTQGIISGIVPLAKLGKYKSVVWYTDGGSAANTGPPGSQVGAMSTLRRMTSPGFPSTLSTYLKQGGKVWLFGGGAGYATMASWNRRNTPPDEFTGPEQDGEIVSGRFLFDFVKWQSAMSLYGSAQFVLLNIPEFAPPWANAAPGRGWTGHGIHRNLSMPNYEKLKGVGFVGGAPFLLPRNPGTDPPSPRRDNGTISYPPSAAVEYMGALASLPPNFIREDADPDPNFQRLESTLDTLYFVMGTVPSGGAPIMTYYHGFETPQLVFSGFPLWFFSRPAAHFLADFVLRDIFGIERAPTPSAAATQRVRATSHPNAGRLTAGRPKAAPQRR